MTNEIKATLARHFVEERNFATKILTLASGREEGDPLPPYQHQEFPKYLHHATKPAVLVENPEQEAQAGDEYHATPAKAKAAAESKAPATDLSRKK
ncbi:MAG: hypothetical protein NVSMB64_06260 [Candidatus Velthaea sp.]